MLCRELRCRGCAHRDYTREASEAQKEGWVRRQLATWDHAVERIRAPEECDRWGYREKTCLAAWWIADSSLGHWEFGMKIRRRGEYEYIAIPDCPIHSPRIREVFGKLSASLPAFESLPLVYVVVTGSLLTLVLKAKVPHPASPEAASYERLARILSEALALGTPAAGVEGVFLNFSPSAGNRVLNHRGWLHLLGAERGKLHLKNLLLELKYGPSSFQQVATDLYEDALSEASGFLCPAPGRMLVDLYSGLGASLALWRRNGAQVIGVELSGEAVSCSVENVGAEVALHGRTSDRMPQVMAALSGRRPALFVNPPRSGMDPATRSGILEIAPDRIAYLSCNPTSLAQDLSVLAEAGYAVRRIIPYDFFPQTQHVEALTLLDSAGPVCSPDGARLAHRPHG